MSNILPTKELFYFSNICRRRHISNTLQLFRYGFYALTSDWIPQVLNLCH